MLMRGGVIETWVCMLQIWATGDVSHADNIMAKDVNMHSLIEGKIAILSCLSA